MAQYKTGTVSVENGSQTVTGSGTLWLAEAPVGSIFTVLNTSNWYKVAAVVSNTEITLESNYAGADQTGVLYALTRDFTPQFGFPIPRKGDVETASIVERDLLMVEELMSGENLYRGGTVLDKDLTTPPGSPSIGDSYIIPASATGDWSGHEKDIATAVAEGWYFRTPATGWRVWLRDEDCIYIYDEDGPGAWIQDPAIQAVAGAEAARDAAEIAETAAAGSAAAALVSEGLAEDWATKTSGAVSGGEYSAKKHAIDAAASASTASTAATNAQTAETAAELAETNAEVAEVAAEAAQAAAEASEALAQDWATKTDDGIAIGSDKSTNGGFTAWTGGNPDNWSLLFTEDASNYVSESSGKVNFVSDGSLTVAIRQGQSLTAGRSYKVAYDITTAVSGTLTFKSYDNVTTYASGLSIGAGNFNFVATDAGLRIGVSAGTVDITLNSITVYEIEFSAKTYAEDAEASMTAAAASEDTASTAASTATGAAATATTKAGEASDSEDAAAASAASAELWASEDEDAVVAGGMYSARHYAIKALASKTAAETAETNAETAETNAETAETNAEAAEVAAAASAVAAAADAVDAAASAAAALASENAAGASETAAALSAADADAAALAAADTALNITGGLTSASVTSMSISTGTKTFVVATNKGYVAGQPVSIAYTTDPAAYNMNGICVSYDAVTGNMQVEVLTVTGSGTYIVWTVALGGTGPAGKPLLARGAWATTTAYTRLDVVTKDGNAYYCDTNHTSGTFATDLAAVKWVLMVSKGDVGMTWAGAWSSVTAYVPNTVVSHGGNTFISILSGTNQTPPTPPATSTYWQLVSSKGDTGATGATGPVGVIWKGPYGGGTAYVLNDVVYYSGRAFICILATTGNAPPTSASANTWWDLLADSGVGVSVIWSDPTDITSASSPVTAADRAFYRATTAGGTISIDLINITAGMRIYIADTGEDGTFATNAVVLTPKSGKKINGYDADDTYALNQSRRAYWVECLADGNYIVWRA